MKDIGPQASLVFFFNVWPGWAFTFFGPRLNKRERKNGAPLKRKRQMGALNSFFSFSILGKLSLSFSLITTCALKGFQTCCKRKWISRQLPWLWTQHVLFLLFLGSSRALNQEWKEKRIRACPTVITRDISSGLFDFFCNWGQSCLLCYRKKH